MPKGEHLKGKGGIKFGSGQPTNLGGAKPKPKFVDLLNEIAENEGKMKFDKFSVVEIDGNKYVEVQLPSEMAMAIKLWNMAFKDVRWFAEMAKIRNMYAPTKIAPTDINGNDLDNSLLKQIADKLV